MNKKDFKRAMQQGLGRCVLALQHEKNIDRFKPIVLWGCLHNLSFDTQCEGTRAAYIYQLTTFFGDEAYFVPPTAAAFEKVPRHDGWLFSHLCELLCRFAGNGNDDAKQAVMRQYRLLLSALLKKRRFRGYDFERDNFECACIFLSTFGGTEMLLQIAEDMGRLFSENTHYSGEDFGWFCSSIHDKIQQKQLDSLLRKAAKASDHIRCFYENVQASVQELQAFVRDPVKVPDTEELKAEDGSSDGLSAASRVLFARNADADEKRKLATAVIEETDPFKKADLLTAFTVRDEDFPLSHEIIIAYAKSPHEELRRTALNVLTNCRSQLVREFAHDLLKHEKEKAYALQMLLCNYTPEDQPLLISELYKLRVDYTEKSNWHSVGLKIIHVYEQNVQLPKDFLLYIYNRTLCSFCRESAVRLLAKYQWLTKDMIEECRYDSNDDISEYVSHYPVT